MGGNFTLFVEIWIFMWNSNKAQVKYFSIQPCTICNLNINIGRKSHDGHSKMIRRQWSLNNNNVMSTLRPISTRNLHNTDVRELQYRFALTSGSPSTYTIHILPLSAHFHIWMLYGFLGEYLHYVVFHVLHYILTLEKMYLLSLSFQGEKP